MSHPDETRDHDCAPRDSVDALLESWLRQRPELDFEPIAVITRLSRIRAHIDRERDALFARFGLTLPSFEALVTLARVGGESGISQRRLADELGLTSGTVSVRIDQLAEQGLVERTADPHSKRNSLVALTDRGRELFERAAPAHLATERRLLAALSDEDRHSLVDLLRKLLVEFEGSAPADDRDRLGLLLTPAHVTIEMHESVGLPGVAGLLVRSVEPGSAAAAAGLQPGDVLIEADGRELRSSASLYAAIHNADKDALGVRVMRGSKTISATIELNPERSRDGAWAAFRGRAVRKEHAV